MDDRVNGFANYDQECDPKLRFVEQREYATPYTFQGVLHFLQSEWNRLEMERCDWETEKMALNTRIMFLEGERRGQENLKKDLVRRIKMLEYALKQERVMIHKYKTSIINQKQQLLQQQQQPQNVEGDQHQPQPHALTSVQLQQQQQHMAPAQQQKLELGEKLAKCTDHTVQVNADWRNSRAQLRKFLEEIDCTDAVLSVRQARVLRLIVNTPNCRELIKENVETESHSKIKCKQPDLSKPSEHMQTGAEDEDIMQEQEDSEDGCSSPAYFRPDKSEEGLEKSFSCEPRNKTILSFIEGLQKSEKGTEGNSDSKNGASLKEYIDSLPEAVPPSDVGRVPELDLSPGEPTQTGVKSRNDDPFNFPSDQLATEVTSGSVPVAGENLVLGDLAGLTATNEMDSFEDDLPDPTGRNRLRLLPTISAQRDLGGQSSTLMSDQLTDSNRERSEEAGIEVGGTGGGGGGSDAAIGSQPIPSSWDLGGGGGSEPRNFWSAQFSLRGHLDSVRAIAFHPTEMLAYSAGEDGCVMLWNLANCRRNTSTDRNVLPVLTEIEPVRIYTGHEGPVLCLTAPSASVSTRLSTACFTGGLDGIVRGWNIPPVSSLPGLDMYAPYDVASIAGPVLSGPSLQPIWSLALHSREGVLAAAHADGTLAFWSVGCGATDVAAEAQLARSIRLADLEKLQACSTAPPLGRPSCLHFWGNQSTDSVQQGYAPHCLVGTSTGWLFLLDVETGQVVNQSTPPPALTTNRSLSTGPSRLDVAGSLPKTWSPVGIYCATSQNTLSLVITGHEDGYLRFYDTMRLSSDQSLVATKSSGLATQSGPDNSAETHCLVAEEMVAHTDAITSMVIGNGHLLVTGSHDASMRVWTVDDRSCISEITKHRFKNGEAINSVAFHPNHPLVASAGADGVCNVYAVS